MVDFLVNAALISYISIRFDVEKSIAPLYKNGKKKIKLVFFFSFIQFQWLVQNIFKLIYEAELSNYTKMAWDIPKFQVIENLTNFMD